MKKNPVIAVVGATGLVGNEILVCLEDSPIEFSDLRLFASSDSEGEVYSCRDSEYKIDVLGDDSFEGVDIAFFSVEASLASKYVPIAIESGALVIDCSNQFRLDPEIPVIVPEVNFKALTISNRLISCPSPSAVFLSPILKSIQDEVGIKRVVISVFESVSGAGKAALDELWSQTICIFNQRQVVCDAFQHQIAFNCIPQVDLIRGDAYTKEEYGIIAEIKKVLELPDLQMTATVVRVPIFHTYSLSVNIETSGELLPDRCTSLLQGLKGLEISSDPLEYPMPLTVIGSEAIHVGRIRRDYSVLHGLNMWIVGDNVRRGGALCALKIGQQVIEKFGD
ncbi:MAG: aspartate-semialdehyde dehydrogenase [SAR324 cluster bacterium]|uniref:Aspartate-semialdehyde dehydrogenase n=1 Tax=SAR324 cluster bacterium TaxID=2024889 RepID=A0A7X9IIN5_9DELT|nr:aspartate-semialdehyde dehydrogenase [SAR324 cluster bacterium]